MTMKLPKFPLERARMVGRAVLRFVQFTELLGMSEEEALEEVYKFFPELRPTDKEIT